MRVRRDRPSRGALLTREREIEKGRGRITGDKGNKENRKRKRITGDKCDKGQGFAEGGCWAAEGSPVTALSAPCCLCPHCETLPNLRYKR